MSEVTADVTWEHLVPTEAYAQCSVAGSQSSVNCGRDGLVPSMATTSG
jgi:hypothetical protein